MRYGTTVLRYNGKWTQSERRGYKTPAMERLEQQRDEALKRKQTQLTVGSLFSGIGGIDLGLERTGHFKTIWFSEIDAYANRVLAKHWPNVPNLGNVKEIDFEQIPKPDVLVGGYPCQPFSLAGKRNGQNDPRHLWPECFKALRVLRPRYALFENVRGHLSLGFSQVLRDLAAIGFNAEWQVIPASAVGAPHQRDRIFIVAYSDVLHKTERRERENVSSQSASRPDDGSRSGSDFGEKRVGGPRKIEEILAHINDAGSGSFNGWWEVEPNVGRVANGIPDRVDRLRALGNAVVPQIAEMIGYLIAEHATQ